eukprot:3018170-Rhodomonas_salina.1
MDGGRSGEEGCCRTHGGCGLFNGDDDASLLSRGALEEGGIKLATTGPKRGTAWYPGRNTCRY